MPKITIKPEDRWFSKCIREAADWTCECCGKKYEENSSALHASHYFSRRHKAIRYCPDNVFAHCFGCHQKLGGNPDDFHKWMVNKVGEAMLEILREKRNDIGLAKTINKNKKDVARHYREEYKRIKAVREAGAVGFIDMIEY